MKGAARIIAINKDADAPIMQLADLAVVGDLTAVDPGQSGQRCRRAGS
jgi:electron transfer flavoprotein alpha subunit